MITNCCSFNFFIPVATFLTEGGSLSFSIDNNLVSPWCVERPQYKYRNKCTAKTSPNGYFSLFKLKGGKYCLVSAVYTHNVNPQNLFI